MFVRMSVGFSCWHSVWGSISAVWRLGFCVAAVVRDMVDSARFNKNLFYALNQESANFSCKGPGSKYVRPLFRACSEQTAFYTVSCEIDFEWRESL